MQAFYKFLLDRICPVRDGPVDHREVVGYLAHQPTCDRAWESSMLWAIYVGFYRKAWEKHGRQVTPPKKVLSGPKPTKKTSKS